MNVKVIFGYYFLQIGVWDKMMKHLVKITRKQAGRKEEPSYALIDSQSVKTTCYGENHGYDGGKNEGKKTAHCNCESIRACVHRRFKSVAA